MDARRTTDNSVLKSHASCFLHPGEQHSKKPPTTQKSLAGLTIPSLKAAALSESGGCHGHGQLGRDVE